MNRKERRKVQISHQLDRDAAGVQQQSLPRTIAVEEFAQARLREVSVLKSSLENKLGGNKRASQDLPRHLRRRASSHNIYRLPARLRARARNDIENLTPKAGHKPKRRERRRPARMIQDHARRARKHIWLETHLWHAKRMRMENVWGYRLAIQPTDKGRRATYHASQHFATLYDASASYCIQIDGDREAIRSHLAPFLSEPDRIAADWSRSTTVMIYGRDQCPAGAIGQCELLWSPPPSSSLWIWVHPAIGDYVFNMISEHSDAVVIKRAELVKFELLGARCQSILSNCLRSTSSSSQIQTMMWKMLSSIRSQSALPRGVCLAMEVADPRGFSTAQHQQIVYPEGSDNRIRFEDANFEELVSEWPAELAASSLWSEEGRDRATASFSCTDNVSVPILLVQRQVMRLSGWDLIVPKGWAMAFWKSLIFAGCRAIGLADMRNLYLEQGVPYFPDDFPDTIACSMQSAFTAKLHSEKHARTPAAKRVNYNAYSICSPFQPDWSQIVDCSPAKLCSNEITELGIVTQQSIHPSNVVVRGTSDIFSLSEYNHCIEKAVIRISVELRWGGVPHNNALVYATTENDRKLIQANTWPGLDLGEISDDRPLIAVINAGGFLYSVGSGIGYGFASVSALQKLSSNDGKFPKIVLLRNVTSKHFHPAIFKISH